MSYIEIKVDNDTFKIHKLETEDKYNLYMKCLACLSPLLNYLKKSDKNKIKIESIENNIDIVIEKIISKLDYKTVVNYVKKGSVNNIAITDDKIKNMSPLLIIELFIHCIKHNCLDELIKKDLGGVIARILGSEISPAKFQNKANSTQQ